MTVKMHCDAPECDAVVDGTTPGWLTVNSRDDSNTPEPVLNFCSWLCLYRYSGEKTSY